MENTQLYDFELTDEEMEQIEALEKMRSMTGTWSISESEVMWKTGGKNEDIIKEKRTACIEGCPLLFHRSWD